jgi:hypothetical protein
LFGVIELLGTLDAIEKLQHSTNENISRVAVEIILMNNDSMEDKKTGSETIAKTGFMI